MERKICNGHFNDAIPALKVTVKLMQQGKNEKGELIVEVPRFTPPTHTLQQSLDFKWSKAKTCPPTLQSAIIHNGGRSHGMVMLTFFSMGVKSKIVSPRIGLSYSKTYFCHLGEGGSQLGPFGLFYGQKRLFSGK